MAQPAWIVTIRLPDGRYAKIERVIVQPYKGSFPEGELEEFSAAEVTPVPPEE
jgi:hypothetical protein